MNDASRAVRFRRWIVPLACLVAAMCHACDQRADEDTSRPHGAQFGFQTSRQESLVEEGRFAYGRYCAGCHGVQGDGQGEAARFLHPRPRNFVNAKFKFSSTRSGQLPTDADLARTLRQGLKGTAMPPFDLLPDRTIDALIAYIKTFSPAWRERDAGTPIPIVDNPYRGAEFDPEVLKRGEAVYHGFATCWSCHPSYLPATQLNPLIASFSGPERIGFRPNIHEAEGKPNDEGELIYPPDFLRDYVKGGMTVEDLYRSIAAGISGTAMPTWVDTIHVPGNSAGDPPRVSQADLWAMAYYVRDLITRRPARVQPADVAVRARPRPVDPVGAGPLTPAEASPATSRPADVEFDF